MSLGSKNPDLLRLLASWCNGEIASDEVDRLEEMLLEDPSARQTYLEYAATEAELRSTFADHAIQEELRREGVLAEEMVGDGPRLTRASARPRRASWLLIAASLVGVAAVSSWATRLFHPGDAHVRIATGSVEVEERHVAPQVSVDSREGIAIARVTATRNCRWGEGTRGVGFRTDLKVGQQLELLAGVAEITFESGARVILEGPAQLSLETGHEAVLERGRLAVTMPPGRVSDSLPVQMARMRVALAALGGEDRGLHFGLSSDGRGAEEVHVFRGDLQTYLASQAGGQHDEATAAVLLQRHEAARVRPASTTLAKFFADKDKFVRSIATGGGPHDGLYAYEGFDYPAGPLSGQNGGFGWAGAWADIEAACPPGEIATNVVEADSLTYGDIDYRTLGGHSTQKAQQNRIRRALSTSLGGVFDAAELVENQDGLRLVGANGKTVYLSFLQRVDRVDDGFYGFELHRGDGNPNRVLCVGNGAEGAGYGVTSNYNAYGRDNYARLGEENVEANLIVVKIEYGQHHRDVVSVYRNPESLLDESGAVIDAQLRGNFAFDRISFGDFDGAKLHEIDEVRVGTSYRAVTGLRDQGAELIAPIVAADRLVPSPAQAGSLSLRLLLIGQHNY